MKLPRILLTAGASGSGKTLLTCGLLQVLKNRGMKVMSFKCGPDYIDPLFHAQVIGTPGRNLDTFFTGKEKTRQLLAENAAGYDIAVLEGVMGYYDGLAGISTDASAYDVASVTETPVVLLVNCKGMSVSIVPYIKGFLEYKKNSRIQGVILNQMSPMLYPRMKAMIEKELAVTVLGYVPKLTDCVLESRHLGLVLPNEVEQLQEKIQKLAKVLEETLDIEQLLGMAGASTELEDRNAAVKSADRQSEKSGLRVAIARDEAFCFIYEDNLRLLRDLGADLIPFSPIHDKTLPENVQGLLLYGGYPELYAKQLSENISMIESIRKALEQDLPCMAECGGFMYLMDSLEAMDGNAYPMVGTISGNAFRTEKLSRFGYITLSGGTVFGEKTGAFPAHEFHYFDTTNNGAAFRAEKPCSKRGWSCMHSTEHMLAGFPHIPYYGNEKIAEAFVRACKTHHCASLAKKICL